MTVPDIALPSLNGEPPPRPPWPDPAVDLAFPIAGGTSLPVDHAHALLGAVAGVVPAVHDQGGTYRPGDPPRIGIHPIRGRQIGGRTVRLMGWSALTVRCPAGRIGEFLPLAGRCLEVAGTAMSLAPPRVEPLTPAAALRSRLVTIKPTGGGVMAPARFLEAARRQLAGLGVSPSVGVTVPAREREGGSEPARRTVRIRGREIVGFELRLTGLTAAESVQVQTWGLGGRRVLGCGVFTAFDAGATR